MKNSVLVTGAGGFIGSQLCEKLASRGYQVRALIRYNSMGYWGWLNGSRFKREIDFVLGDIRSYDSVKSAVKGVHTIYHLAALIGIPYSYISPDSYVDTNVKGTLNILQSARDFDVRKVVHTSTSEVYGTAQQVPIDERHPLNPQSPYAATKLAGDNLALSFWRSFDLPVAIVRPFNAYGPRQSARAVIPTIIMQALAGNKTLRLGSISPTRDFTYVDDATEGFIKVAGCSEAVGEVINLGSNFEISIADLVGLISRLIGVKIKVSCDSVRKRPAKSEVERLFADNAKAARVLGWKPKYSLREGLAKTIEWFRAHRDAYKAGMYNV